MFQVKLFNNQFANVAVSIASMGLKKNKTHQDFYKIGSKIGNLPLKSNQTKNNILNNIRSHNYPKAMAIVEAQIR